VTKRNFLLAKGERLTKDVTVKTGGQPKEAPYTFAEARARLKPMLADVAHRLNRLPAAACPDDSAVASVTLNPEYMAKTYFPSDLLHSVGLTSVGSRPKRVTPQKRSRGREPEETVTTEMFLMGTRAAFRDWSEEIGRWQPSHSGANQLTTIEAVTAPAPSDKLIHVERADDDKSVFEVVLHTGEQRGEDFFVPKFKDYLKSLGLSPPLQRRFYAGGLCFLELEAPRELIEDVAAFSLVRAIRPMPALRMLRPPIRTAGVSRDIAILPTATPIDPKLRSVIFDGGLPAGHPLTKWATPIDAPGVGPATDELLRHGVGVTSAFLFGHLRANKEAPRPFGPAHHYRVIDTIPGQNPCELYEVLDRIESVLTTSQYDFINLSLGPELPSTTTRCMPGPPCSTNISRTASASPLSPSATAAKATWRSPPTACRSRPIASMRSPSALPTRPASVGHGPLIVRSGRAAVPASSSPILSPSADRRRGRSLSSAMTARPSLSRPAAPVFPRPPSCAWGPACARISATRSIRLPSARF
jgi:hypothetical protein